MTQFEMIDVDGVVGQRNRFDRALQELDVGRAGLPLVLARQREHLVGHVQAVDLAGRSDALGREQDVDAAAGSEVEHRLARLEREQRGRIAAPERRRDRFGGQPLGLRVASRGSR